MPTPQRLPTVNGDDGVWGDILRQYLMKEHFDDGTNNAVNGGHQKITVIAGTTAAGTAPIKLTSGTLMTTPEAGAIEFSGDAVYFTQTTGPTRKKFAIYDDASGATGDIYYRNSSNLLTRLGAGSTGDYLTIASGIPSWTSTVVSKSIDNTNTVTLKDTSFTLQDATDTTKQVRLDVSASQTTATTRTITLPTVDSTLATLAGTETLTNKTLTAPRVSAINDTNGSAIIDLSATSGSTNYLQVLNSNAGSPAIKAVGSSTDISIDVQPKNAGRLTVNGINVPTISSTDTLTNKDFTSSTNTFAPGVVLRATVLANSTGTKTYTIASGSITQISGTTVDGITAAIGDKILVHDSPATTGVANGATTQPGNGLYIVTANTTNLTVSRATEMAGSNSPLGKLIRVERGTFGASSSYAGSTYAVTSPTSGAFTYGTISMGIADSYVGQTTINDSITFSISTERTAATTLTNKRITPRVGTTTSTATPAINTDNYDIYTITALAANITGFTMSGTPTDGQPLRIAITGTATRTITWGSSFEASTTALPTTTVGTARLDTDFVWNAATSKWRVAIESTGGGSGTVTATGGALTANSVILGAGTTDTKVSTGITSDGASQLNLGVNNTTAGKVKLYGSTSGDVTLQSTAAAGTATVLTLPATTDTLVGRATTDTLTNKTIVLSGTAGPTYTQGKLVYDTDNEALTFYNNDSNVSMQLGQEDWIRVSNNSGSTIPNGSAVYISGAASGWPTIALAKADASTTTIGAGLTTESIANGATGYVTSLGMVRSLDTSAFTAGQTVYISAATAGALTATAPSAPNYRYRIGIVGVSSASVGTIHVTPSTAALGNGTANQISGMNNAATLPEMKSIVGTTGNVSVTHSANTITLDVGANVVTATSTTTMTNKTMSGSSNTFSNISSNSLIDGKKISKIPKLPATVDSEKVSSVGAVSVVSGGYATTISSGVQIATMASNPGMLGLTGTTQTSMVNVTAGYYGPGWKDDASAGTIGSVLSAPFASNMWVSGSRYVEFITGYIGYSAIAQYGYRVWIDGHKKTDLPVITGFGGGGSPNSIKIDLGDTKPHLVRLDMSGMALESAYVEPAGTVWAANNGPRLFVLGCSLTGSISGGMNTGYESGTWLHRFANMVGITDYWNGGEYGTGPNTTASSGNLKNYKTRATTQVIPAAPDVVIIDTWFNDYSGRTGAQIAADTATTIATIQAGVPNVKIIVIGGFDPYTTTTAGMTAVDTLVEPVCTSAGVAFISGVTGRILGFDGTLLATTSKWITSANMSTYISSIDNTHPTDAGHEYIAYQMRNAWALIWGLADNTGTTASASGSGSATPTASTLAMWDANINLSADAFIPGFTTTATAAGTTTLTIASNGIQAFTGSSTQTVKLPTTSVVAGAQYTIINSSTGAVTVQSSGANTISTMAASTTATFTAVVATPTTAANWSSSYTVAGGGSGITRSVVSVTSSVTLGAAATTDYVAFVGASGAPTLPTAVSNTNRYSIKNVHSTNKTVTTTSSQTIDGSTTITLIPNQSVDVVSDGSNWQVL